MSKFVSIQSKQIGVSGCVVSCIVKGLKDKPVIMIFNVSRSSRFSFGLICHDERHATRADRPTMADLVQLWYEEFDGVDFLFKDDKPHTNGHNGHSSQVKVAVGAENMSEPEIPAFLIKAQERRRAARLGFAFV